MINDYSNYLAHHGVKGMRWGHRKETYKKAAEKIRNRSKPESSTWKAKDAGNLSNEELDRRNQRLQKENQYRSNVDNAHPVKKEVKQAAKKILLYSAVGAMSGIMAANYRSGAGFIGKLATYKLPL